MTTFADHQHPHTGDGRFTAKGHPEAELELSASAITLSEATGDWGPRFHDMDYRPVYEYTPTDRAAAAFRTQFGAALEAEVGGEYCFESLDPARTENPGRRPSLGEGRPACQGGLESVKFASVVVHFTEFLVSA